MTDPEKRKRDKPRRMNPPDKPGKTELPEPSADKDKNGEYQFNLGLFRIETLNNILNVAAQRYHKALLKKDRKRIEEYRAIVNTLYTEVYIYIEGETDIEHMGVKQSKQEVLTNILDQEPDYSNQEEVEKHLKEIREIYLAVRQLIKDVGMDIPREQKIGKTELFQK